MKHIKYFPAIITITLFTLMASTYSTNIQAAPSTDEVVGNGTPGSCTEASFDTALATVQGGGGGTITFNCGGATTIPFTSEKIITITFVTIDGGGNISLSGGNTNRLFNVADSGALTLRNITLKNGYNNTLGGGAILNNNVLFLEGVTIRDSNVDSAVSGGAILSYGGLVMEDSLIENNTGGSVGGIFMFGGGISNANVSNSTFRNNRTTNSAYGFGGAITLWNNASLILSDSILEQNQARYGGAIYIDDASNSILDFDNLIFRQNSAIQAGGAIYSKSENISMLQIDGTTFANNTAVSYGGGIYSNSDVSISDSTFSGNSGSSGGGFYNVQANAILNNTVFYSNSASYGGAISNSAGNLNLSNTTISNNSAGHGGAIANFSFPNTGIVTLNFVTMSQNSAPVGGAIYNDSGSFFLNNVILNEGAVGVNCDGPITSNGFNISSDDSCGLNQAGDQSNVDPMLGPLADNGGPTLTHMPLSGSPAINTGQCIGGITTDQRGYARPQEIICDKGAVERQPDDTDSSFIYLPLIVK